MIHAAMKLSIHVAPSNLSQFPVIPNRAISSEVCNSSVGVYFTSVPISNSGKNIHKIF